MLDSRAFRRLRPFSSALLTLTFLPALAWAGGPKCDERVGYCITVVVNGQPTVKLTRAHKKLVKQSRVDPYYTDDARYELAKPVEGRLTIQAGTVPGMESYFGAEPAPDISVVPLDEVELKTHGELAADATVQVGGAAAVTHEQVLDENRLPPGRYLLVVRMTGSANWDRQVAYFEVEGE